MSDYAGPILGVVGAVIGSVVPGLGTAAGWTIGYAIGSAYSASQQVIPGPKIGDVQKQTSQEGGFRPIVYGRSHPIMGNVIADGGPIIVKKPKRQGGKGGPKVETEYAYRTYAVGFCEGEAQLLQAWRNGILVYDAEDPSMGAENAKFWEYAAWYTGGFEQMPDPDLQGIYGVGGTPAFRGTAYLVLSREDVTDQRGAWSQWQVRVFRGAAGLPTTPPYVLEYIEDVGVDSLPARLQNVKPPTWTDNVSMSAEPVGIEVRLMSQTQVIDMGGMTTSATPVSIENLLMRVTESSDMGGLGVSSEPVGIEVLQIRIVLDKSEITEMNVTATPQSIEVIIP